MPAGTAVPSKLKIQRGWAHPRDLNKNEPEPSRDGIEVPKYLSVDAKKIWKQTEPELSRAFILTNADIQALAIYCECWVKWRQLQITLETEGLTTFNAAGSEIQNPNFKTSMNVLDQMHKFWDRFGMNPVSRTRINAVEKQPNNKFGQKSSGIKSVSIDK